MQGRIGTLVPLTNTIPQPAMAALHLPVVSHPIARGTFGKRPATAEGASLQHGQRMREGLGSAID
ncbi:MAG: hypothetical protein RMK64_00140 [Rhodovarius sp.]|nr:hypothetical protein [Rhodovarius sp.]MDW8313351.1 hypothetical protein [Rhodovarius sp.]